MGQKNSEGNFADTIIEAASADEVENADEMPSRRRERRLVENLASNCPVRNPESGSDPVVTLEACLGNGTEGSRNCLLRPDTGQLLRAQTLHTGNVRPLRVSDSTGNALQLSSEAAEPAHPRFCTRSGRKLRLRQPATLVLAQQLAECVTEIEEGQRRAADDGLDRAVEALARLLDKLEETRDRPSRLHPSQRAMECFYCGGLGHIQRDCPQLRARTWLASTQSSRTRDRCLLAMTELQARQSPPVTGKANGLEIFFLLDNGAVVSVVPMSAWRRATEDEPLGAARGSILLDVRRRVRLCGQGIWSLQLGNWRGQIHVTVVENLVVPGISGTNFFDHFVKVIDWQDREMTMTDGGGCARITPIAYEVPREETGGVGPETDNGDLEACECALVDGAECSARSKQALGSILPRCRKAHYIETEVVQPVKLPPRTVPLAQREVMDQLIREMLQAGVIEPAAGNPFFQYED
ncbi:hypothetical protein T01_9830 [Trichinella spiralis]|uniref:CCHC-type domain-containing protein n=1 Tax=Trichinella spiralis TaxID=6334 RepID=A0A0V1B8C2_TRISP|nr:hypothetical protein T01_9830 [Trichinella spiralis]